MADIRRLGGDIWDHVLHHMHRDVLTLSGVVSLALTSKAMWRYVRDTIKWEQVWASGLYGAPFTEGVANTRAECWRLLVRYAKTVPCAACWNLQTRSVPGTWLQHYNLLHNRCFACFTRAHIDDGNSDPLLRHEMYRDVPLNRYVGHLPLVVTPLAEGLSPPPRPYVRLPAGTRCFLSNEVRRYYRRRIGACLAELQYDTESDAVARMVNLITANILYRKPPVGGGSESATELQLREMIRWAAPLAYCVTHSTDGDQLAMDEMDWEH